MKSTLLKPLLIVLFLFITISQGCKKEENSPELQAFTEAKMLWESSNISKSSNYIFTSTRVCFCTDPGTYRITVVNNAITDVRIGALYEDYPHAGKDFKTIDQLFQFIEASLKKDPAKANIKYDALLGYPTEIDLDFEINALDDEVRYNIKDLQLLIID
ncbi:MAG TPA: DUF6174 domain-containing protein [Pedobacter sp.]|jgi:hypothetical protein